MKTIQEICELGIKRVSNKSSVARKHLTREEIKEFIDSDDFELFNILQIRRKKIINCLKANRPFYFLRKEYNIKKLDFLINE